MEQSMCSIAKRSRMRPEYECELMQFYKGRHSRVYGNMVNQVKAHAGNR